MAAEHDRSCIRQPVEELSTGLLGLFPVVVVDRIPFGSFDLTRIVDDIAEHQTVFAAACHKYAHVPWRMSWRRDQPHAVTRLVARMSKLDHARAYDGLNRIFESRAALFVENGVG